jgi:phosphoglycerate dehydrogenase-like enzyme
MMHVHLTDQPADPFLALLRSTLDERIRLTFGPEAPQPATHTWLVADRPNAALLETSPHLTSILVPFAGVPTVTLQAAQERGLAVYNIHHNSDSTAEFALSLLLAAAKRLPQAHNRFYNHDWRPRHDPMPALILHGKTALILGYGAIGERLGRMCYGLGMRVLGVKRRVEAGAQACQIHQPDELHPLEALPHLLPRADALLICLPLTDQTRGLIGAAELALMPPKSLLVNVGRGAIVDEAALYQALQHGPLFGAALDVWYRYPETPAEYPHHPPANYPFHDLPNTVLSPHRAGGVETEAIEYNRVLALAEILNAAVRGEAIPNRVELSLGY